MILENTSGVGKSDGKGKATSRGCVVDCLRAVREGSLVPRGLLGIREYTYQRSLSQGEGAELLMHHPVTAGELLALGLMGTPEHFLSALQKKVWPPVAAV